MIIKGLGWYYAEMPDHVLERILSEHTWSRTEIEVHYQYIQERINNLNLTPIEVEGYDVRINSEKIRVSRYLYIKSAI